MPSDNRIILASAGSGKTTTIVTEAGEANEIRTALITYTVNGRAELSNKAYNLFGTIPAHIDIKTWYTFILEHFVRPYQNHLYATRVTSINFTRGVSTTRIPKSNSAYFFSSADHIRLDKVTDFVCELIQRTGGLPIERFSAIYDHLYIDESQDLSGHDLELIEMLLKCGTQITLIGDHRQATFNTNDSRKNKAYTGMNIIKKFQEWDEAGIAKIKHQAHSYRCIQAICDFADGFHPDCEPTTSRNNTTTDHDGVFCVRQSNLQAYCELYHPQALRYNRRAKTLHENPMNYGAVKGMTFERTIIYPHGPLLKYLKTGNLEDAGKEIPKLYVAVTRAKHSVAFVVPDKFKPAAIPLFEL